MPRRPWLVINRIDSWPWSGRIGRCGIVRYSSRTDRTSGEARIGTSRRDGRNPHPFPSRSRGELGSLQACPHRDWCAGVGLVPEGALGQDAHAGTLYAGIAKLVDAATAKDGEEVFPNVIAEVAAGHTPGHLVFVLKGKDHDIIFTGDAAKNRAELLSRRADMTYNAAVSTASIGMIWKLWTDRPGNILVPGHDLLMAQKDGHIEYLSEREAAIKSWFGDNLETTTLFELTVAA